MKYIIYAPEKNYTGISATVGFVNGKGETDNDHLANWFRSCGYTVEEVKEPKEEKEVEAKKVEKKTTTKKGK